MKLNNCLMAALVFSSAMAVLAQDGQTFDVAPVVSRTISRSRALPGEFQPYARVALHAKITGYVKDVLVDRGSLVKRGQVLATLEAPELLAHRAEAEARLAGARAQHVEAQAKLVAAQNTFDGLKAAAKTPGAVAENELVQAEKAADAQRALVASIDAQANAAAAAVQAVVQLEAYLRITAPFDGVITERNVHPGALVGPQAGNAPGTPMLQLEQTRRLRLVVAVPEADVAGIERGSDVDFTVPAFRAVTFHGKVARLAESLDPKTRTMAVELDVMNGDARLAPGMYAQVNWPIRNPSPSLLVPATSVVTTTERMFVIRVRNGKAEWVDVRRGAADKDLVEVTGDLKPGDEVVTRGSDEIRAGTPIVPKRQTVKPS